MKKLMIKKWVCRKIFINDSTNCSTNMIYKFLQLLKNISHITFKKTEIYIKVRLKSNYLLQYCTHVSGFSWWKLSILLLKCKEKNLYLHLMTNHVFLLHRIKHAMDYKMHQFICCTSDIHFLFSYFY